jgi:hypothetical protein
MIIILGLIILVAALVVAVAGIMGNAGSAHQVSHFSVLGYHLTGSSGTLFLAGIVVGAAGLLGLSLLLAGARRTSRRGSAARRGLQQSRRETAAATQERDDLIDQRDTARAYTASNLTSDSGTAVPEPQPGPAASRTDSPRRSHPHRRPQTGQQPRYRPAPTTMARMPPLPSPIPPPTYRPARPIQLSRPSSPHCRWTLARPVHRSEPRRTVRRFLAGAPARAGADLSCGAPCRCSQSPT